MKVIGSVPASARRTFVNHFRYAQSRGWSWTIARSLARPLAQNDRVRGSILFVPAVTLVKAV